MKWAFNPHTYTSFSSRYTWLHVNSDVLWKTLQQCWFSFLYHVEVKIIFLFCELSQLTHGVVGQMGISICGERIKTSGYTLDLELWLTVYLYDCYVFRYENFSVPTERITEWIVICFLWQNRRGFSSAIFPGTVCVVVQDCCNCSRWGKGHVCILFLHFHFTFSLILLCFCLPWYWHSGLTGRALALWLGGCKFDPRMSHFR